MNEKNGAHKTEEYEAPTAEFVKFDPMSVICTSPCKSSFIEPSTYWA